MVHVKIDSNKKSFFSSANGGEGGRAEDGQMHRSVPDVTLLGPHCYILPLYFEARVVSINTALYFEAESYGGRESGFTDNTLD